MADTPVVLAQTASHGYKVQATDELTAETLVAADFTHLFGGDSIPIPTVELGEFLSPNTGASLDRDPGRRTTRLVRFSWSEQIGGVDDSTPPYFDGALRASGYQRETVRRVQIGSVTGEFQPGEDVTATGKVAVVVSVETDGGDDYLCYVVISGGDLAADEALTGGTSAATVTVDSGASAEDCGYLYRTLSESSGVVPPALTINQYRSGTIYQGIGARGNARFVFNPGAPALVEFEFGAPWVLDSGAFPTGTPPAGISLPANNAPRAVGATATIDPDGDAFVIPVATNVTLDTANEGDPRETLTLDVAGSGFAPARIVDRSATVGLQIDFTAPGDHDFYGVAAAGSSVVMNMAYGDWTAAGGSVHLHVAAAQYQAPQGVDRAKILGLDLTADLRRGARDDWAWFLAVLTAPAA